MTASRTIVLLACVACSGKSPFPSGLAPLEDNRAPWPSDRSETIDTAFGSVDGDDPYTWGHARGYVQKPLSTVYASLVKPRVAANRRSLTEYTVEQDVEDYPHSYALHNRVEDIINLEFTVVWRHGALAGDEADPEEVGSRWQKTEGSDVIELLRGSVYSWAFDERTTALEIVIHQRSLGDDREIVEEFLDDYYADIRASSHGEPLPEYESGL